MNGRRGDFLKFWTGQTISTLGTAFSGFALPLLVFQLTHSALNLAITTATFAIPYVLFGLVIGAWVDRVDRKRLMIAVDLALALVILVIPVLAFAHHLTVWWVYGVQFVSSTLSVIFEQAEFTAIPSLVGQRDLVTANGRIHASYHTAQVLGPVIAGAIVSVVAVPNLLIIDSVSYVIAALALLAVAVSFNRATAERRATHLGTEIMEGLRYVVRHPVLRNISLMMMLFNFVNAIPLAQEVFYAKVRLHATNFELGILFASGGVGAVLLSLLAGRLRRRFSFSAVVLGCLMASGVSLVVFSQIPWIWLAVPIWLIYGGSLSLLDINTFSLRQAIVPNELLGRILAVAGVLGFSASPIGSLAGGFLIQQTHNVAAVYAGCGILLFLIPLAFTQTALGHADRYLPPEARAAASSVNLT